MESSIEDAHLRQVGQQGFDGIDTFDVGGVVEGGEVIASRKLLHDFRREEYTL